MNKMICYDNKETFFNNCPACDYANHEYEISCGMAYENNLFTLSQDWELPIAGFMVISPKKHIENFNELTKLERDEMFDIVNKTINILKQNKVCDRFNVLWEEKEGRHFHAWIVPRYKWMSEKFGNITKNLNSIFNYALNNLKTEENFIEISRVNNLVKTELNKKAIN